MLGEFTSQIRDGQPPAALDEPRRRTRARRRGGGRPAGDGARPRRGRPRPRLGARRSTRAARSHRPGRHRHRRRPVRLRLPRLHRPQPARDHPPPARRAGGRSPDRRRQGPGPRRARHVRHHRLLRQGLTDRVVLTEARPAAPEAASPGTGAWRWIVLTLVVVIGLGATLITGQQAEDDARDRQRSLAVRGRRARRRDGGELRGGGRRRRRAGAPPTARSSWTASGTYAREIVAISPINVLAFEPVITAEERAAFEEQIDGPILDQRDGELVPAAGATPLLPRPSGRPRDRGHPHRDRVRPAGRSRARARRPRGA